ncbi:DUF2213 domain-containing protein [Sphingobium sp. CFD-1]|uniref:DUF2213 domain-containing protein n=1 Tax=Sphingobium sp. CFD-1 TaxID=2878545 RepID=UPI00214C8770|nr:DUF2213 domain-containing protein [Sphingobium sp. CFD-1]
MLFADQLTLDAPRRTQDGYLAVRARAARVGVYQYAGHEVDPENKHGLRDQAVVNVLRDDATVFDAKSVHSFIGKPVTDNHPSVPVSATNWRDHARGIVMGAMRDGEYLAFDLMLTDAGAIQAVENGKRELSNGYQADLTYGQFKAADGTICQAKQVAVAGNHVAIVDRGRAGPSCAIKDSVAICDANAALLDGLTPPLEKPKMKITIGDAKDVDLSDGAAVALAVGALNTSLADAQTKVGTLTADLATANTAIQAKDGEIAVLNAKLKDVEVTPAKLQQLADARADVIGKAKALAPSIVTDGKSDAEIRKEAVTAKLGDAAKDMADAAIEGAFLALTKDAKPADPLRTALSDGIRQPVNDAAVVSTIRNARYA